MIELDTPEMEDIVDFITENKITMHVLLAHENPYRNKHQQQGFVHWSCKISDQEHFIIIYFSKGAGIRRWQQPETETESLPLHVPLDKTNEPYDGPMPPFKTEKDQQTFQFCSYPEPPFLIEVLDILATDITLLEQTESFAHWAKTLGVTADSQAAKFAYDIISQQRIELISLLGEGTHHKLLYEIDRLRDSIKK